MEDSDGFVVQHRLYCWNSEKEETYVTWGSKGKCH